MLNLLARIERVFDARYEALNAMNVFPIPDADTGTNLLLTVRAGRQASEHGDAALISDALVRGARGNSGVILSQVLRAFIAAFVADNDVEVKPDDLDPATYARALTQASELSQQAVATPVEGTMLTAIQAAAVAAEAQVTAGADLAATSMSACRATAEAVRATPTQLPTLRRAGVVDAGARGFELVITQLHHYLCGVEVPVPVDPVPAAKPAPGRGGSEPEYFEVQYIVDTDPTAAPSLQQSLESIGDSVVVGATRTALHAHVHTRDTQAAIEAGTVLGTVSGIEVDPISVAGVRLVAYVEGDGLAELARAAGAVVIPTDATWGEAFAVDTATVVIGQRPDPAQVGEADTVQVIEEALTPPAVVAVLAVWDSPADLDTAAANAREAAMSVTAIDVEVDGHDPMRALTVACEQLPDPELVTVLTGSRIDGEMRAVAQQTVADVTDAEVQVIDAGFDGWFWVGAE